jgi:hypothetical protein
MAKQVYNEYVNTSYTTLYLVFTITYSIVISSAFENANYSMLFAVVGYAILSYFIWDLIRQLFYPGQAVVLYVLTFLILPVIMNLLLSNSVGTLAIAIYIAATFSALLFELVYESLVKRRLPKGIRRRLLSADSSIDRSIVPLSIKHIQLTEYRGMAIALILITTYFLAITYLLHN